MLRKKQQGTADRGIMAPAPHPACPSMEGLPDEALAQVAAYFQVLSEPTRLQILNLLRPG